jgi:hypothetical protein
MNFEYRGVKSTIPTEMLVDARDHIGIDIPTLLRTAIDRMLRVSQQDVGNFRLATEIQNPSCEPNECVFNIRVFRIDA